MDEHQPATGTGPTRPGWMPRQELAIDPPGTWGERTAARLYAGILDGVDGDPLGTGPDPAEQRWRTAQEDARAEAETIRERERAGEFDAPGGPESGPRATRRGWSVSGRLPLAAGIVVTGLLWSVVVLTVPFRGGHPGDLLLRQVLMGWGLLVGLLAASLVKRRTARRRGHADRE